MVRDKKAHSPRQKCQRSSVPEQVQMVSVVTDTLRISQTMLEAELRT